MTEDELQSAYRKRGQYIGYRPSEGADATLDSAIMILDAKIDAMLGDSLDVGVTIRVAMT